MSVYLIQWVKKMTLKFNQALMTLGQFMMIPALWFLFTHEHNLYGLISATIVSYLFGGIGFAVSAHRYFTHRAFKVSPMKEKVLSVFTVLGTWLSPAEWAFTHWHHHKHSDTEQDVHSSKHIGFRNWFFYFHRTDGVEPTHTVARLLTQKWHQFLYAYKHVIILAYATLTLLLGYEWFFYLFIIPTAYSFFSQIITVNNHVNGEPKDSWLQNILTLGEGYHAYHHKYPKDYEKGFFIKAAVDIIKDAKK